MGDFEDVFGVGADADKIIESYNREYRQNPDGYGFYVRRSFSLQEKNSLHFKKQANGPKTIQAKRLKELLMATGLLSRHEG